MSGASDASLHLADIVAEADRLMTICNSCRYCEGICAMFPALELRRVYPEGDLNYLANLCHGCGACFDDCQFAPPHEFHVNVPQTMAKLRNDSYAAYSWPRALAPLFARNGLKIALATAASVAVFILGFAWSNGAEVLFAVHQGPGAFYRLMPHGAMAGLFGAAFLYALVAMAMSLRLFWRDNSIGVTLSLASLWQAMKDASRLRYLDGGGDGCVNESERKSDRRRLYHHFTFYGFLLCLAATIVATLYHYLWGREAPYPWYDLPVVLGTLGGIGLVIGPLGLFAENRARRDELKDEAQGGMDTAFIAMLFLNGVSGLALLFLRETPLMGVLLALHLGFVFSLFLTMPYGKFMHGIYRFAALVRYAREREGGGG